LRLLDRGLCRPLRATTARATAATTTASAASAALLLWLRLLRLRVACWLLLLLLARRTLQRRLRFLRPVVALLIRSPAPLTIAALTLVGRRRTIRAAFLTPRTRPVLLFELLHFPLHEAPGLRFLLHPGFIVPAVRTPFPAIRVCLTAARANDALW